MRNQSGPVRGFRPCAQQLIGPPPRRQVENRGRLAVVPMHQVAISCFPIDRAEPGAAAHLARDEWDRAGRFRFARDRQRFVAGRARVRRQLSELCGVPAASLEF